MKMKIEVLRGRGDRTRMEWKIQDVQLTGSIQYPNTLLSTSSQLLLPVHEKTMSLGVGSRYEWTNMEYTPVLPSVRSTCETPVFFFIYNTDNYFHFLYDTLPFLLDYARLRKSIPTLRLLMAGGRMYPFVRDCLDLLGISADQIVYADGETLYREMYVVNSYTHDGISNEPPHPDVWALYAQMKERARYTGPLPRKIYVSRRSWLHGDTSNIGTNYTTRRRMMCEDELVEALVAKGYTEVFCEQQTMAEKICMFANATHVVGAIGGGMCNLVFASPECRARSIHSPWFDRINERFLFTMKHVRLTTFTDTRTTSMLYRRARVGEIVGEIVKIEGSYLHLHVSEGAGWNAEDVYATHRVREEEVTYLDEGLNSPWDFDVKQCTKDIE